jgi:FkbM family methyltransferase
VRKDQDNSLGGVVKTATKKLLRAAGFELRRIPEGEPLPENRFNWLKNLSIGAVLDIGANTGQFAMEIHKLLPDAAIYSFEPLHECYAQLTETMKNVSRFKAFNFALGEETSELTMHRSEYSPSSSILPMRELHKEAFPFTKGAVLEKIAVKRLDDIADSLTLPGNFMVKIDVQGFEDKVLRGGHDTISKARALILETSFKSLYEGQPLFHEIYQIVKAMGFAHHGNWSQLLNPVDGSVLQADAIFLKNGV